MSLFYSKRDQRRKHLVSARYFEDPLFRKSIVQMRATVLTFGLRLGSAVGLGLLGLVGIVEFWNSGPESKNWWHFWHKNSKLFGAHRCHLFYLWKLSIQFLLRPTALILFTWNNYSYFDWTASRVSRHYSYNVNCNRKVHIARVVCIAYV